MKQASPKKAQGRELGTHLHHRLREAALYVFGAVGLVLILALATFDPADPGWSHSGSGEVIANAGGVVGAWFADLFLFLFGVMAYLFPLLVIYVGWLLFHGRREEEETGFRLLPVVLRGIGFILTLAAGSGLAFLYFSMGGVQVPHEAGGVLGQLGGHLMIGILGPFGGVLVLLALFLTGVTLFTGLSWLRLADRLGAYVFAGLDRLRHLLQAARERLAARRARQQREQSLETVKKKSGGRKPPRIEPAAPKKTEAGERAERERQVPLFEPSADAGLPALALLDSAEGDGGDVSKEALEALSRLVEKKLQDFGIEAEVVEVHPGPVITRFELQPAPGVKVSQVSNLSKDLARSLSAVSVRVVEVIPGKTTIGLEVPNDNRETVRLSEIINSRAYEKASSPLTLALGKDIGGESTVADLAKMPHLLVAGTTGSGKSVALNAMILSLLYNATPRDVRLIMVDPKMLELSAYEGVPHLLTPVVTDMKDAANALRWCVGEMERRYQRMAALKVRNLAGYNRKVQEAIDAHRPLPDPMAQADPETGEVPTLEPMPRIVVVVDELADMMMVVGKKVEELIARLAQKARAAGIHLILATQRPSVDVLTGLIKANIPARVAFQVSSRVDSRTILDQMGAETLLGHGDMLFLPPGQAVPQRIHGAFVDDAEVYRVVDDLRKRGEPDYLDEILEGGSEGPVPGAAEEEAAEADPLYDEAVRVVTETRRASISGVQRRLKIGYNRAARMVEEMERAGVVGPLQSNGSREVLVAAPPED